MKKSTAIILMAALLLCGCGKQEETTVTGMVMSVEGTQVSLISFEGNRQGAAGQRPEGSERPTMPEGEMPTFPEGEMPTFPEGEVPQFSGGQRPEGGERPTLPEGETRPQGEFGSRGEGGSQRETTVIDLADTHITVEFDGGKATGSMEDIKPGVFLMVTLVDGKATNAVVSENSGFGGNRGNFGNGGFGKDRGQRQDQSEAQTTT